MQFCIDLIENLNKWNKDSLQSFLKEFFFTKAFYIFDFADICTTQDIDHSIKLEKCKEIIPKLNVHDCPGELLMEACYTVSLILFKNDCLKG